MPPGHRPGPGPRKGLRSKGNIRQSKKTECLLDIGLGLAWASLDLVLAGLDQLISCVFRSSSLGGVCFFYYLEFIPLTRWVAI